MSPIVRLTAFFALGAALIVPASWVAAADNLIPGKIHIIKEATLTKMVAKPVSPATFPVPAPLSSGDPTVNGGLLTVIDTFDGLGFASSLPVQTAPLGWKGLGSPAGINGYKYKGAGGGSDPCKVVLVKPKVIKFVCKDDQELNPALGSTSGINLAIGNEHYCAEFGGTEIKNIAGLTKRKDASPPAACSGGSTTTSTSSTTTLTFDPMTPCCGGFSHGAFTSGLAGGTCGTITNFTGATFDTVTCGGLYFGGGLNAQPLPAITPDLGSTVLSFASCSGQTATVAPTTSTDTGSNRNCSSMGCFFGGPVPVPNAFSTPLSTCMISTVRAAASGSVDCALGTQDLSLPLEWEIFLTGDMEHDPAGTIPGIQPCPLCSAGSCIGGPNHSFPCVPDDTDQGGTQAGYPTSHDCPPDPMFSVATVPIDLALTTGTVSWIATVATNDTGGTASMQTRVFCGYCRDRNSTNAFQSPAQQCWAGGVTFGSACAEPFESCEQDDNGAYGPGGSGVNTITVNGSAAGPVVDGAPHAQTLVTNFCIPPTFDSFIDALMNLPGPGTLAVTGNIDLCASANPCP